jgi:fructokinase
MSIICLGELLIDFVALESGVTVGEASGFIKAPGGAPANVAVAAARLGHQSAFLTQLGDDPFGDYLKGVLDEAGVNTQGVLFTREANTALAFVSLRKDGDRSFSFYRNPSADMLMRAEDLPMGMIDSQRIFHFGSITMISEPSRSATLAAAERARDKGLIISYDPNLRLALWESEVAAREGMMLGLAYAHIVKISEEELVFLTGGEDALSLWQPHMKLLAVTRGAGGATLYTADQVVSSPGFTVHSVDTTGAGDAFVAGLLSGLLEHGEFFADHLDVIARFANAVGAITTTQKGAIPALPTRRQVMEFLADH